MTTGPGGTDAAPVRLPAYIDTLEALRLSRRMQEVAGRVRHLLVDASGVEEIGLAGLQLLALVKAGLAGSGGTFALADPSTALRARIADAGMTPFLLDGAVTRQADAPPDHSLAFRDAALDYGREPVEALCRLREAGISVEPVLPDSLPPIGEIEADRLLLRFDLRLHDRGDESVLAEALAEFGGDAVIDAPPLSPDAAAASPPRAADAPADRQAAKLERLMSDVEELMTRHAALAARHRSLDQTVVAELKAMDGVLRSLQDHAIAAGLVPLGVLLQRQIAAEVAGAPSFPGSEIEIEPGAVLPLLPALTPLIARNREGMSGLSAREAEGVLAIEMPVRDGAAALAEIEATLVLVRGRGALVDGESGPRLRVELPRSRAMLEALILRAGEQLAALPVDRAVEILRPEAADLTSVGAGSQLMRFRGTYLPIVDLAAALGRERPSEDADATVVVVVQSRAGDFGIRVRDVTDHRQVMVKPLDDSIPAGAGVIGLSFSVGGIALVLDIEALRAATLGAARA